MFPWLIGLCVCLSGAALAATGETVLVPWRAGNADSFQTGAVEERRARSAGGSLPVTIYKPDGAGPFPFIAVRLPHRGPEMEARVELPYHPSGKF